MLLGVFAPEPLFAQQVVNETISRFVERDRRTVIWRSYAILPNCETVRGFNVRIEKMPSNGVVALEKIETTISNSLINFRSTPELIANVNKCLGRPLPVIAVYYTPNPAFTGFDSVGMVTTSANARRQRIVEFKIAVR